jgi:hypothetical protein
MNALQIVGASVTFGVLLVLIVLAAVRKRGQRY